MSVHAQCFHCSLPVKGERFYLDVRGASQVFCCAGCQMVAQTIIDNGLLHYYDFREQPSPTQWNIVPPELLELRQFDDADIQSRYSEVGQCDQRSIILSIEGITCAACIWLLEKRVGAQAGISKFSVNLSNHRAQLVWDDSIISLSEILLAIAKIGYRAQPFAEDAEEAARRKEYSKALKRLAISGFGFGQVMMFAAPLYSWFSHGIPVEYRDFFRLVSLIVTTPVLIYCGLPFFRSAWRSLKTGLLSMDVSISFALLVVYVAGVYATVMRTGEVYFDSITMFLFFITLSRFLEMRARHRSGLLIQQMSHQQPGWVMRVCAGLSETVALNKLNVDDVIIVKSGSAIPVDGVVTHGIGSVNESLLTGESLPKEKRIGDAVAAGSLNVGDPLTMKVTRIGDDTTLAAIMKLFERAQYDKPRMVSFTQKVSHYFVLIQLVAAVFLFAYWLPTSASYAFWTTISLLVISCPCALAVATPVALTSAMNALSRLGFFCTRGHVLESLVKTTDIIFDKTGTLTEGKFSIKSVKLLSEMDETSVLEIAAALESQSEHPIATAFKQYETTLLARDVCVHPNQGVEGVVNGVRYRLGHASFVQANETHLASSHSSTCVYLANENELLAVIHLEDKLRLNARQAVASLINMGYRIHLLSGDNERAVRRVADELNISVYTANCSPAAKLEYVKQLQQHGAEVVMLGDGINDAPVLMQAQVSIAMASAADLTRVSADAVLMNNDLTVLATVLRHAGKTHWIIRECLIWAVIYNIICLPLAVSGIVAPYIAAVLMSLSSILVVANALRLVRVDRKRSNIESKFTLQAATVEG